MNTDLCERRTQRRLNRFLRSEERMERRRKLEDIKRRRSDGWSSVRMVRENYDRAVEHAFRDIISSNQKESSS